MFEYDEQPQDIHLIEFWGSPTSITNNPGAYLTSSVEFVQRAGFTIMDDTADVYPFPDKGLTFEAILSESGIMGHTWPDQSRHVRIGENIELLDYANYLLHTCKQGADFSNIGSLLIDVLQAKKVKVQQLLPVPPSNYRPFITTSIMRRISESRIR